MSKEANSIPISVVIPTLNRPESLRNTILSYLGGSAVPEEIIIVDQSYEAYQPGKECSNSSCSVRVISSNHESSSIARNIGIREARAPFILFSDDDILVNDESLALLYERIRDDSISLVAGYNALENRLHTKSAAPSPFRLLGGLVLGLKKPWEKTGYVIRCNMRGRYPDLVEEVTDTEWAMGYFFCIKKEMAIKFDCWFDEKLGRYAYAEDLDFSFRYIAQAKQRGTRAIIDPKIVVEHLATKEWRVPSGECCQRMVINRRYLSYKLFPKKHWYRIAMNWFDMLWMLTEMKNRQSFFAIAKSLKLVFFFPSGARQLYAEEAVSHIKCGERTD